MMDHSQFVWPEKHRPTSLDEMVMPPLMEAEFRKYVEEGSIPHLLFSSPEPGLGKTTAAKILAAAVSPSVLFINAAKDSSIDVIRTKVSQFATTMSLDGASLKIVILDEFERMGAAQDALKETMEGLAANCRFILTTNHPSKVIEPIRSRCIQYDFSKAYREHSKDLMVKFFKRVCIILDKEEITYDKATLASIIKELWPDMRSAINSLRKMTLTGTLIYDPDAMLGEGIGDEILQACSTKKYKTMRELIETRIGQNTSGIWPRLWGSLETHLVPETIPAAVMIISEFMYKDAFVADKSINAMAMLLKLSAECKFNG